MDDTQLSFGFPSINRPQKSSGAVAVSTMLPENIPGGDVTEKITVGVDRYGRTYIEIICDDSALIDMTYRDEAIAKILGLTKAEMVSAGKANAVRGEMTPDQLVRAKKMEGQRTYFLDSYGTHRIGGGKGPTFETNIKAKARAVIDPDAFERHKSLLEHNAVKISELVNFGLAEKVFTKEQARSIFEIAHKAFGINIDPLGGSMYRRM